MKIAILSDTHGLLRPQVVEHLKTADAILHAGDINKQSIVDEMERYAPSTLCGAIMTSSGRKRSPTTLWLRLAA